MEGFSYHNIFETKGIEYIVILAFFAILIPFWIILNRRVDIKKSVQKLLGTLSPKVLNIPQGLFFSKNHTWTHLSRSGVARVGLDDLLVHITGKITLTKVARTGDIIRKGDLLAEIDHEGKKLTILSPISGEVLTPNTNLKKTPELLYQDPLHAGWICKVKPADWIAETQSYYLAERATDWTTEELTRLKDFLITSTAKYSDGSNQLILQDGGELRDHTLSELPTETWQDFQKSFLTNL